MAKTNDINDAIERIGASFGREYMKRLEHGDYIRDTVEENCESPIELLFALAWGASIDLWKTRVECSADAILCAGNLYRSKSFTSRPYSSKLDKLSAAEWINPFSSEKPPHNQYQRINIIESQVRIGTYRADFVCRRLSLDQNYLGNEIYEPFYVASRKIIVECDGHDFHERTKEQAAHDKSRDRALLAHDYSVMRFTGSELWRDAFACAKQVSDILDQDISIKLEDRSRLMAGVSNA